MPCASTPRRSSFWRPEGRARHEALEHAHARLERLDALEVGERERHGSLQGQPFTLTGLLSPLWPFLSGRNPLALDLSFATEGATALLAGKIGRDGNGLRPEVTVKVHVERTAALTKMARGPVDVPVPLDLSGRLALTDKTWRLDGLAIAAGQTTVAGNLALRLGPTASELTAALSAVWRSGEPRGEVLLKLDRLALKRQAGSATDSLDLAGSLQGHPFTLAGSLAVKGKTWRMDRLEIASGRSTASGNLVVLLDTPRPHVTAVVDAPLIDLPELAGWKHDDGKEVKVRGRRLFADAPLPFDVLRRFNDTSYVPSAQAQLVQERLRHQRQGHLTVTDVQVEGAGPLPAEGLIALEELLDVPALRVELRRSKGPQQPSC